MRHEPGQQDRTTPFIAAEVLDAQLAQLPAGWEAAQQLQRLRQVLPERTLRVVTERAIDAVLQRARGLVRHAARPLREVVEPWPQPGELDLDRTLDQPLRPTPGGGSPWQPEDVLLTRREPRDAQLCVMLDMSLSMTGEKIALTAVAAAILHMKLEHLALVAFDTEAVTLVRAGERVNTRELVRRVLLVPAQGYTNIHAGLEAGLTQLRQARPRERIGLLLSDGVANVGWDPVKVAVRFPALHVIQLGRDLPAGTRACRRLAQAGRGRRYHAPTWVALPTVVKRVVRELFRA